MNDQKFEQEYVKSVNKAFDRISDETAQLYDQYIDNVNLMNGVSIIVFGILLMVSLFGFVFTGTFTYSLISVWGVLIFLWNQENICAYFAVKDYEQIVKKEKGVKITVDKYKVIKNKLYILSVKIFTFTDGNEFVQVSLENK